MTGEKLRVAVQKGLVDLPADLAIPIVCVGPGTGIAPLRAIIEDRVQAGSCGMHFSHIYPPVYWC